MVRSNFKRRATTGAHELDQAIVLWEENTREHSIGSGSARTMNMNDSFGICELHRELCAVPEGIGRAQSGGQREMNFSHGWTQINTDKNPRQGAEKGK
ncbi:MAG TPA: hypothetical protein VGI03_05905 [Verrucomicrobiae bacterium]